MLAKKHIIPYERSDIIPIKQPISPQSITVIPEIHGEYSLKQHFFDPSKSSPPNEFMMKLHKRVSKFHHFENKEDNFVME